ncbi:MAG: Rrf2 family transcriptional regulator [Pirellulales bacterium]|nr:Rrf2 family transcriptional regulator [Pirellulales bacterium]
MRVSAKTEYACIAMLELAARYGSGEPVRIRDIAEEHDIPSRFLVQILLQLKGAGFVASTRGAAGGYQLLVPPDQISLRDVMVVIEGPPEAALTSSAAPTSSAAKTLLHVWREVTAVEQQMLGEITFAELVTRAKRETDMYYI